MRKTIMLSLLTVMVYLNDGSIKTYEGDYQLSHTATIQEIHSTATPVRKGSEHGFFNNASGYSKVIYQEPAESYYLVSKDGELQAVYPKSSVKSVDVNG